MLLLVWLSLGARVTGETFRGGPHLLALAGSAGPAFVAAIYAWWQAARLGGSPIGRHAVRSAFFVGVVALSVQLGLNGLVPILPGSQLLGTVLLFFGLSLSGLALASLRRVRVQQHAAGLSQVALNRDWLLAAAVFVGLVLAGGLAVARVVAPEALDSLDASLGALAGQLVGPIGMALAPLVMLVQWLTSPFFPALARLLHNVAASIEDVVGRIHALLGFLVQLLSVKLPRLFNFKPVEAWLSSPGSNPAPAGLVCWRCWPARQ